jgi:hypothetical protein
MWITAWHTIMGLNSMCPHLYLYSMKGARKRDFPPTISHHQPYWRHNKLFEEYSARLCYFATAGKNTPEICIIHPLESRYIEYMQGIADSQDKKFEQLLERMMSTHRNFDIGDEQIISETGTVKNGKFIINKAAYRTVLLPEMLTIRKSTVELLNEFNQSGGTVLLCGGFPSFIDGEDNPEVLSILKDIATEVDESSLREIFNENDPPLFSLSGQGNEQIWSHLRTVSNGNLLQLSNTSRLKSYQIHIRFANMNVPTALWNPVNGDCLKLESDPDGSYSIEFAPAQTWILSTGNSAKNAVYTGTYVLPKNAETLISLNNLFEGRRLNPNAIVLDFANFSIDNGKTWTDPEPVLAFYERSAQRPYKGPLMLKFEVQVDELPENCSLVMEQPEMYTTIQLNGKEVKYTETGFYIDAAFKTQSVLPLLKKGKNEIILSLDYLSPVITSANARERYGTEIESIYLTGDFAVSVTSAEKPLAETWRSIRKELPPKAPVNRFKSFVLNQEKNVFSGDITTQGYPFYAGSFEFSADFDIASLENMARYKIIFPEFEAILIEVNVNGTDFPVIFSNPWESDITEALLTGKNQLRITLTNGLRNLLGPHHHTGGEFTEVGPATFHGDAGWPNTNIKAGDWDWYDARLSGNPVLWRDTYHTIPFGILDSPVIQKVK